MRVEWPKQENLNNVKRMLKHQKLEKILNLTGNLYPDLMRVFFTNLSFEDVVMYSHVKGVDMDITLTVWTTIVGLKNTGRTVGKGNTNSLENYNKNHCFRSCLTNPLAAMRGFHIGGLSLNLRIFSLLVV